MICIDSVEKYIHSHISTPNVHQCRDFALYTGGAHIIDYFTLLTYVPE
jgi:hypothetical protein